MPISRSWVTGSGLRDVDAFPHSGDDHVRAATRISTTSLSLTQPSVTVFDAAGLGDGSGAAVGADPDRGGALGERCRRLYARP